MTTDAGFDAARQRSDIETALAAKPNVILALPLDPVTSAEAFKPGGDRRHQAGVPVQPAGRLQARHRLRRDRHRRPVPDGQAGGRRAGQRRSAARARSATSSTTPATTSPTSATRPSRRPSRRTIRISRSSPSRASPIRRAPRSWPAPCCCSIRISTASTSPGPNRPTACSSALRASRQHQDQDRHARPGRTGSARHGQGRQRRRHSSPTRPMSSAARWPPPA